MLNSSHATCSIFPVATQPCLPGHDAIGLDVMHGPIELPPYLLRSSPYVPLQSSRSCFFPTQLLHRRRSAKGAATCSQAHLPRRYRSASHAHANSLKEILHDIFQNLPVQKNKVREQTYAAQLPSRNLWCETIKVQKRYMNILFPYLFNFIPDYS